MQQPIRTKKLAVLAMLSALAYLLMVFVRIPVVLFLKYEPKDVIIVIGGFLFGPLAAFTMSVIVSFVEMVTVSDTGWIGCVMNIVSTCSFACVAAFIYKIDRSIKGAVIGLVAGSLCVTAVMMLWNYFLTPIYMGMPREAVAELLIPYFLPFNLLKSGINSAITVLLYKPLGNALRKSRLMPAYENANTVKGKINISAMLVSCFVLITCVLLVLVLQGRI